MGRNAAYFTLGLHMVYHEKLRSEVTDFVAAKIVEGLSPSKILREMHKEFGELHAITFAQYLGEGYKVRPFDIMTYLNGWWFNSPLTGSDPYTFSDETLDRLLGRVIHGEPDEA